MKKNLFFLFALLFFIILLSFFRAIGKTFIISEPFIEISNIKHSDLKGKTNKIIYFWTTWCSVCQSNLPLMKFSYQFLENRLNTKFFSFDDASNGIDFTKRYLEKNEIEFPVYIGSEEFYRKNFVYGFPTILFINESDKVIFSDTGIITPIGIFLRMLFVALTNV
jgi:thiol-disulfide isomerase/thioredoxin